MISKSHKQKKAVVSNTDSVQFIDDQKIHIVIDAGHGGKDVGAINFKQHIYEKTLAKQMADAFTALADTSKYAILVTRTTDSNLHRHNRVWLAQKFRTDLFLSFHCNAHTNKTWNGTEIHISDSTLNIKDSTSKVNPNAGLNTNIATLLSKNIAATFPNLKSNGVVHRKDRIWVIYASTYPSVIIEWGYISNKNDINIMKNPSAQQLLAKAVWQSVDIFFASKK